VPEKFAKNAGTGSALDVVEVVQEKPCLPLALNVLQGERRVAERVVIG
jgi:hypothetical protein